MKLEADISNGMPTVTRSRKVGTNSNLEFQKVHGPVNTLIADQEY